MLSGPDPQLFRLQPQLVLRRRPPADNPDQAQQCPANFRRIYRLLPGEAIVLMARTPPESRYFSYCAHVNDVADPDSPACGPQGRPPVFASLGDTVNLRTTKTSGTPVGKQGNPSRKNTVLIMTAGQETDRKIRSAAEKVGFPAEIMNTLVIPSAKVHMGFAPESAEFSLIDRVAI